MPAALSGLARITIRAPRRRLDLSVPAQVPLAELLPEVVIRAGEAAAGGWMLRRGDGGALATDAALAYQGVRDGDVLYLVPRQMAWPEPAYDDVVEEMAAGARSHGPMWTAATTRAFALAGVGLVLLGGLAALLRVPGTLAGVVSAVAGIVLLAAGALISRALGDGPAGAVAGGGGALYAAASGALLTASTGPDRLLVAGSALVFAAVLGAVAAGYGLPLFAAYVVAGTMAMVAAALSYSVGSAGAGSIVCVLVAAGIGLAPLLAVRLGRLPLPIVTADPALLAGEAHPPRPAVRAAVARADDILAGSLLGLAAVALGCVFVLAPGPVLAARLLALLTAAAVLMRARMFPAVAARLPLLAAGTLGLVYTVVVAASGPTARLVAGGTGLVVVIALLAVATTARRARVMSPYLGRLGDIADVLAVVAMAPLACVVLGLFDWVRGLSA